MHRFTSFALHRIRDTLMALEQPVLPLPRRPWSDLSDHAPLAAEITL